MGRRGSDDGINLKFPSQPLEKQQRIWQRKEVVVKEAVVFLKWV